jgi:hypothetical protein
MLASEKHFSLVHFEHLHFRSNLYRLQVLLSAPGNRLHLTNGEIKDDKYLARAHLVLV